MTDKHLLPHEAERNPIVFMKDGEVFANSRDVAAYFGKNHRDVVRAIDNLLEQEPSLGVRNFAQGSYLLPETGSQQHRCFDMDRRGFSLLAMGFTGQKALRWKLKYIDAFEAMEANIKAMSAQIDVRNPAQLTQIALQLIEVNRDLEGRIEEMRPQVQALERIALSDGSLCITDAAKTLQVQPKALFQFLRSHRWIYSRQGTPDIAYQDKLASGLLEHKTTTVTRSDGSEKTVTQVRVTPKGLTRLAREFPPVAQAA